MENYILPGPVLVFIILNEAIINRPETLKNISFRSKLKIQVVALLRCILPLFFLHKGEYRFLINTAS